MGAYKSDYIKAKETARNLRAYRFRRADEPKATSKQIDYLVILGEKHGKTPSETLDWVTHTFILEHCHNDVGCFMDLTKNEVSQAIARLKETKPNY